MAELLSVKVHVINDSWESRAHFQFFTLLYCVSDTFCDIPKWESMGKLWGTEFVISSFY